MLPTLLFGALLTAPALASDHAEAPLAQASIGADLSDLYVWHDADKLNVILTIGWHEVDGPYVPFDEHAIFGVHIDRDGDNVADADIWVRFAADLELGRGIQVSGMPGTSGPVVGPIETEIAAGNGRVMALLADDPFFMDLEGFIDTVSTGTLSFDGTRDTLAGSRVDAVVLQMDLAAATAGSSSIQVWATSGRKE